MHKLSKEANKMTLDEYVDSGEFTNEWYTLFEMVNSERFAHWMAITDENCSTHVAPHVKKLIEAVRAIEHEFEKTY